MDPLDAWRDAIERILSEYAAIPYRYGDVRTEVVFDRTRDRYLIVDTGWERGERMYGTIVHVDICDGRVWVQYDGTEAGRGPRRNSSRPGSRGRASSSAFASPSCASTRASPRREAASGRSMRCVTLDALKASDVAADAGDEIKLRLAS